MRSVLGLRVRTCGGCRGQRPCSMDLTRFERLDLIYGCYVYIICACLGFFIMYLKAVINKSVSPSVDVGHIG